MSFGTTRLQAFLNTPISIPPGQPAVIEFVVDAIPPAPLGSWDYAGIVTDGDPLSDTANGAYLKSNLHPTPGHLNWRSTFHYNGQDFMSAQLSTSLDGAIHFALKLDGRGGGQWIVAGVPGTPFDVTAAPFLMPWDGLSLNLFFSSIYMEFLQSNLISKIAIYLADVDAARIAVHAGLIADTNAYTQAVLADFPFGLWLLDEYDGVIFHESVSHLDLFVPSANFFPIDPSTDRSSFFPDLIYWYESAGFDLSYGRNLFKGPKAKIPDGKGPYVSLIRKGGQGFEGTHNALGIAYERPSAQVVVRATDYDVAEALVGRLYFRTLEILNQNINGCWWRLASCPLEPFDLPPDEKERPRIAFNVDAIKRTSPATS